MRALGIPNSRHFHDITTISAAQALFVKLQRDACSAGATATATAGSGAAAGVKANAKAKAGEIEEFEDSEGNVLSRRMYEDLSRQGLL